MMDRVARTAAKVAKDHQRRKAKFKRRSGRTAKAASARIFRTKRGRRIRITNKSKTRDGKPLALFLEGGTRPHIITARRARVLKFFWRKAGRVVFRYRVRHPGTRPYHFIRRSAEAASEATEKELRREMQQLARQF